MKNNPENIVAEFAQRRDLPNRVAEAAKTPLDYLVGNLYKPRRCVEVQETDGSTGCLISDFEGVLKMHGGAAETAFSQW